MISIEDDRIPDNCIYFPEISNRSLEICLRHMGNTVPQKTQSVSCDVDTDPLSESVIKVEHKVSLRSKCSSSKNPNAKFIHELGPSIHLPSDPICKVCFAEPLWSGIRERGGFGQDFQCDESLLFSVLKDADFLKLDGLVYDVSWKIAQVIQSDATLLKSITSLPGSLLVRVLYWLPPDMLLRCMFFTPLGDHLLAAERDGPVPEFDPQWIERTAEIHCWNFLDKFGVAREKAMDDLQEDIMVNVWPSAMRSSDKVEFFQQKYELLKMLLRYVRSCPIKPDLDGNIEKTNESNSVQTPSPEEPFSFMEHPMAILRLFGGKSVQNSIVRSVFVPNVTHLGLERLKVLNLQASGLEESAIVELIRAMPRLTGINLSRLKNIGKDTLVAIGESCANLELLNLTDCRNLDDNAFIALIEACKRREESATKQDSPLPSDGALQPSGPSALHFLSLSCVGQLTDKGMAALMKYFKDIRDLSLYGCFHCTDNGFIHLRIENVERLNHAGCYKVSQAMVRYFFSTNQHLIFYINPNDFGRNTNGGFAFE
eukprot:794113_1